jgi:hypothetical protein
MGYFPDTIAAALAGRRPRFAFLVEFGFDTPVRFWNGNRTLTTLDSNVWLGARQLGEIAGLEDALAGEAKTISVIVSGAAIDATALELAIGEDESAWKWKLLRIWLQFFDEDWKPIDNPYALQAGLITGLSVDNAASGETRIRTITVEAVNLFYGRSAAPNGYYTDSDQQDRFAGDLGLEFIPALQDTVIDIPWS